MGASIASSADPRTREFVFGEEDFAALRALVKAHTGIHLSEQKREMVYGRLSRRLRALGLSSFRDYRRLLDANHGEELVQFCNAITTNLTAFFREAHHFKYLAEHLAARAADANASRRLRIWSAGCSSGEEPYTLAMTILESLGERGGWDARILATDIDTEMLAKARRGSYAAERVRGLDPGRLARFFCASGTDAERASYTVSDPLRELVCFRELNLMHTLPMKGPLDAVFCRNVVIYFDRDTQRALFARIARLQPPGALLFLGHSENLFNVSDDYSLVGKTIYRRN